MCEIFFLLFQITLGGIVMLRDTAESQDGPEELIEPLKGTKLIDNAALLFLLVAFACASVLNTSVAVLV